MHAYEGSRLPHASSLHWNPPGFRKINKVRYFSNRPHTGQTKRNIEIRLKEQLKNIMLYQIGKSALAVHVRDKGHGIQNETKLLKHITNPKDFS